MFFLAFCSQEANTQCPYNTNYLRKVHQLDIDINASLDTKEKKAICNQNIKWTNPSNVEVKELRFYMYLNSFKNMESTFLKGSNGQIFGSNILDRKANEWAYLNISNCKIKGSADTLLWKFIQLDDGNTDDQSVIEFKLPKPIKPGASIELTMDFVSKLPKFIARAGYSRDDFYAFLHWFPQMGVFEKDRVGEWNWNCHQFFRSTEFYAEFANYKVNLTVPEQMIIAASGCKVKEVLNKKNKTKTVSYDGRDIIDFAWLAYPKFEEYVDEWQGVEIKMFIPQEHKGMAPRYLGALKNALNFFNDKIGKYPYPTITLMDPPMHGMGSGFMEYPMLITCASIAHVPSGVKTIESLAVHEFSHQFFMGILASNEKEEAWMDEGFVTFFEDEIADHYFGEHTSIFNLLGYRSGNKERSRLEYTSMDNLHDGPIARPGWMFNEGNFKELIYAKTATTLQTLKGMIGEVKFYTILKNYFNKYKFSHPRENDFISSVKAITGDSIKSLSVDSFFYRTLHGTEYCDYSILSITQNSFTMQRLGGLVFPQEILVKYSDGSSAVFESKGESKDEIVNTDARKKIVSVTIDPSHKIYLDINFNNNSKSVILETKPAANYSAKAMSWFQHILQTISFFV